VPNCLWIVHSCVVLFCFVWLHPVSCIPNVAIVSGLSILVLYCFVLFDFILCLVFPMLPLSLNCPFLCCIVLFCLTSSCVLYSQCCHCLWIVHSWLPLRFALTFIYN
jgi:hypothetical protein